MMYMSYLPQEHGTKGQDKFGQLRSLGNELTDVFQRLAGLFLNQDMSHVVKKVCRRELGLPAQRKIMVIVGIIVFEKST